jgi:MFS family permease
MVRGTIALLSQRFPFMLVVIFLMSVQSTVFSPAKYSSLPELLPEGRLSWGNGLIGMGTFVAIIGGGVLAGVASSQFGNDGLWKAGPLLLILAIIGLVVSFGIPRIPAANQGKKFRLNFLSELGRNLQIVRPDRVLR